MAVAAIAWWRTLADAAAMGDAPGTMGMDLVPFVAMWVPMMAAMMLPAVTPIATLWVRAIVRNYDAAERVVRIVLFAAGYIAVWTVAGIVAFSLMRPVERGIETGLYTSRSAAAIVLALAGIYQLSSLRETCLARCRSPAALLGIGTTGPATLRDLRAGALHGAWCAACCWPLMAVLALVGLMNVAAMVVLAAFVFLEKTTPFGLPAGRVAGIVMLAWAAVTLAGSPVR